MEYIRKDLKDSFNYIKTFLKWIIFAIAVGFVGGALGSLFHLSIDFVTELRI